ncbi:MAG: RNA polymerase sigma factor [Phycisphaeraceae bacterium]
MKQTKGPWPTTQWTLIDLMAGSADDGPNASVVGGFLGEYLAPLKAYLVRRRGLSVHDAEDVLQEFILQRFLSRDLARHVDQARGRFRTFLLTSLDNFLSNHRRHVGAQKRSPGKAPRSLADTDTPANPGPASADDLYEVEWARMIVHRAIAQVREHCERTGRPEVWHAFETRVIGPILRHTTPISNEQLAQRLGMDSPQQVANAVATAKRTYKRALYGVIVQYARNRDEVEAELAELRAILARHSR